MRAAVLLATTFLSTGLALAQAPVAPEPAPAGTPDGARSLAGELAAYVTQTAIDAGILKVEPDPAGYRLRFDPATLGNLSPTPGDKLEVSPYSAVVSRRSDGNWNVFANDPIRIATEMTVEGVRQALTYDFGRQVFKGIWSPEIASFQSGSGTMEGVSMKITDPTTDMDLSFGPISYDVTGTPAAGGAADVSSRYDAASFKETINVPMDPSNPAVKLPVEVTAEKVGGTSTLSAVRSRALLDGYAFFLAHAADLGSKDTAKLAALNGEVKNRLQAVLPLWDRLEGASELARMKLTTSYGGFTVDRLTSTVSLSGISDKASLGYVFGFDGLAVQSMMMPPWVGQLTPTAMQINFRMEDLDLKTPVDMLLADLDISRDKPISDEVSARAAAGFTANPPRFLMGPSRIAGPDYEVTMSGNLVITEANPSAQLNVQARGIDKVIGVLQSVGADNPEAMQAAGGLSLAKGFSKPLPDGRVEWVVDLASNGSVKVNGFEMKGPDEPAPVPVPEDEAPTDENALPQTAPEPGQGTEPTP